MYIKIWWKFVLINDVTLYSLIVKVGSWHKKIPSCNDKQLLISKFFPKFFFRGIISNLKDSWDNDLFQYRWRQKIIQSAKCHPASQTTISTKFSWILPSVNSFFQNTALNSKSQLQITSCVILVFKETGRFKITLKRAQEIYGQSLHDTLYNWYK